MHQHANEEDLFELLKALSIPFETYRHPPLFTVDESKALRGDLPEGGHCKSLFLKDKRNNMALVVMLEHRKLDLKRLGPTIGLGRISFGSPERMLGLLGVTPGSVTPYSLMNAQGRELIVVLDKEMLEKNPVYYHPLHNEATIGVNPNDLLKFIEHCGFKPLIHKFS